MILNEYDSFAKEIGGEIIAHSNDMCMAIRMRNLDVTIQDHSSKSPLIIAAFFSYEINTDNEGGDALCLCQIPVTENEINLLVSILKSLDFKIDTINSSWLKADPQIYHLNAHVIDDPTIFAININHIFSILKL